MVEIRLKNTLFPRARICGSMKETVSPLLNAWVDVARAEIMEKYQLGEHMCLTEMEGLYEKNDFEYHHYLSHRHWSCDRHSLPGISN